MNWNNMTIVDYLDHVNKSDKTIYEKINMVENKKVSYTATRKTPEGEVQMGEPQTMDLINIVSVEYIKNNIS